MERLRQELDLAEQRSRVNRAKPSGYISSGQLEETYDRLIRRATACASWLSTSAPKLAPEQQFKAAVNVQMIEELVDVWRKEESI